MRSKGIEHSVIIFLQGEKNWLCNRCIARVVGAAEPDVRRATRRLQYARRYYVRMSDIFCSSCGASSLCIRSLESGRSE